jgi:hypothetical protein
LLIVVLSNSYIHHLHTSLSIHPRVDTLELYIGLINLPLQWQWTKRSECVLFLASQE